MDSAQNIGLVTCALCHLRVGYIGGPKISRDLAIIGSIVSCGPESTPFDFMHDIREGYKHP